MFFGKEKKNFVFHVKSPKIRVYPQFAQNSVGPAQLQRDFARPRRVSHQLFPTHVGT